MRDKDEMELIKERSAMRTVTQGLNELFDLGMNRGDRIIDVGREMAKVAIEKALEGNLDWFKLVVDRVDGAQTTKLDLTVLTPEQANKARALASVYDTIDALPAGEDDVDGSAD